MTKTYNITYSVSVEVDSETGQMVKQVWRDSRGILNFPFGPAILAFDPENGNLIEERWMKNGETSRLPSEGPASIYYDPETGVAHSESYFAEGELHRVGGPAKIRRDRKTGAIIEQSYYLYDKKAPKPDDGLEPK